MKFPHLKSESRNGKFMAAYLYLRDYQGPYPVRTKQLTESVLIDFGQDGKPVGVEILAEEDLDASLLNELLRPFGVQIRSEALVPQPA